MEPQTLYCLKLSCVRHKTSLKGVFRKETCLTMFSWQWSRPLTELTRPITPPTDNGHATIKKELSICPSLLCLDLVSFPVLCQTTPQAPLLVVPFRQFLYNTKNFDFSQGAERVLQLTTTKPEPTNIDCSLGVEGVIKLTSAGFVVCRRSPSFLINENVLRQVLSR